MDTKSLLKSFIDKFVRSEHDDATDYLNNAIEIKTKEILRKNDSDTKSDELEL